MPIYTVYLIPADVPVLMNTRGVNAEDRLRHARAVLHNACLACLDESARTLSFPPGPGLAVEAKVPPARPVRLRPGGGGGLGRGHRGRRWLELAAKEGYGLPEYKLATDGTRDQAIGLLIDFVGPVANMHAGISLAYNVVFKVHEPGRPGPDSGW